MKTTLDIVRADENIRINFLDMNILNSLTGKLHFKLFLVMCFLAFVQLCFGQMRIHNTKDTFFYFTNYNYYLNKNYADTAKLYLKIDSTMTDTEKLSEGHYTGICEYASFKIDKKEKRINVALYDKYKKQIKIETYSFKNTVTTRSDSWFFNASGVTRILIWKVITPF
jgi:hypothetical protein